jgi:RNA polymerase sigma-70 factor (ECF subfamily)
MLKSIEKCKELSDTEIVHKSLENVDYFTCMYLRYEAQLKRYIMRISQVSIEEAEDILQEAFLKIWKNLNAFDPSMKLSSWIYRIIRNQTISYWRTKKREQAKASILVDEYATQNIFEDFDIADEKEKKQIKLQDALNNLTNKYKEVIVLKFFEKMSYEEISDVLEIPEGTVAVRINRAKKAIKKMLMF